MKRTAIRRVTIELTSGTQIVLAPGCPSLSAQVVLPCCSGRIGRVLEVSVSELLEILQRIKSERADDATG